MDGQVGDDQQRAVYGKETHIRMHHIIAPYRHTPRNPQRAVKPGIEDCPAVYLYIYLGIACRTQVWIWLDPQTGKIRMGGANAHRTPRRCPFPDRKRK